MQRNPAWLNSPSELTFPPPPTDTRAQTLPYQKLSWENFERLILRVVRREATVTECWIYGERGEEQYGLDIIAELSNAPGEFACYQCKRVKKFSANDIKQAVDKFLQGKWACKAKRLVLCTSLHLSKTKQIDEISKQRTILGAKGIEFETWEGSEAGRLSERLKNYPDLVDDFFLRDWVRLFNGPDAADLLGERLDGGNLAELRAQLRNIYSTLFHRNDQGIRLGYSRTMPLLDRYVTPAVIETREVSTTDGVSAGNIANSKDQPYSKERQQQIQGRSNRVTTIQELRTPVGGWLSRHNRSVILGEPGYGKSALLRVTALQLLNGLDDPFSLPWHGFLPVWISFGGFSAAVERQNGLSIEDYFDQWLHQHGADHIRPLFRRAVKHGEILILIDGLDEGQNSYATQQAMDRLSTFLSIRPIPAVLTSRPRGYIQVRPDGTWPLARLAAFDEMQIECFARAWFKHLETPGEDAEKGPDWAEFNTEQRKEAFLKAIRANPRVMDLARTPLFCQLLIDVFRFSHHLPEQRIKVYDRIIDLLLSDHPAARVQAAGIPAPPDVPRTEDMREMLMRLALHIQVEGGAGVISAKDCQTVFCDFLTDDINGPGYSPYEAQHQAKSIIDYAQTGLGLVVERAPNELGFFHPTVQEYLAAQAMVRKEEQAQLDWLVSVWDQSRWQEVVLAWFSIMGAEQGKGTTQRAIDHLKQTATGSWAKLQLLRMRIELAASDLGLSPREARVTIEEAANQVETTPFPEIRQELARHITLGLRSSSVACQCEERIANWVPARSEWERVRLLGVFGNWQMSEDLLCTLKLALHDESGQCRWAAAESLARAFASEAAVGEHLVMLAAKWPDAGVRAAALHGLGMGWPKHETLNDLADAAGRSTDMNLVLSGIALRVANHRQDDDDRQRIWFMFIHDSVSYEMRDFCRVILVRGWNKDEKFKRIGMDALCNRWQSGIRLNEEQILSFLAESWPGDSEVGRSIANWFQSISGTFLIHDQDKWKTLFKGFRSNKDLSPVLRQNLLDQKSKHKRDYWDPNTKWAYCLLGDHAAKMDVLEAYSSVSGDINKLWVISTLMEAWPDDSDVKGLLTQEFHRSPGEVAFLARWIDSFIPEPETRRAWLLEALRKSDRRSVRSPVHRLLQEFHDEECLAAVLAIQEKDIWYYDKIDIQGLLIATFPHVAKVRQWAESTFSEIDGPSLAHVAAGYQHDQVIRGRLLRAARPAKANVRAEVFREFREYSIPRDRGLRLTKDIWAEEKGEIRSAGVVARCIMASQSPELKIPLVTKLREEIKSLGTHYEMRRRAAFAGLLQLAEYAICIEEIAKETSSSLHWLATYHDIDVVVTRMLFENWDKLHEASQNQLQTLKIPWGEIVYNGTAREAFSNSMARTQLIDYLKTMQLQNRSTESLALMAELLPNSVELRACLIEIINQENKNNISFEAQRILAEQFGDDEPTLIEIQENWNKPNRPSWILPPFLYALALGWPHSPLLRPYLEQQELPKDLPLITTLALCGISGKENHALACIDNLIQITLENGRALPDIYWQSLRNWARTPCAESLLRRLLDDRHPSRKITAMGLLATIGKLTNEDRMVFVRQFDEVLGYITKFCPDGVDLVNGTVTTLPQAICRFLSPKVSNAVGPG
ncbi:MAG: NACHT domain-containing protein [Syntrophales bacterium]|nr:NACHT domain-containing protein [Syntrophales bacterium]